LLKPHQGCWRRQPGHCVMKTGKELENRRILVSVQFQKLLYSGCLRLPKQGEILSGERLFGHCNNNNTSNQKPNQSPLRIEKKNHGTFSLVERKGPDGVGRTYILKLSRFSRNKGLVQPSSMKSFRGFIQFFSKAMAYMFVPDHLLPKENHFLKYKAAAGPLGRCKAPWNHTRRRSAAQGGTTVLRPERSGGNSRERDVCLQTSISSPREGGLNEQKEEAPFPRAQLGARKKGCQLPWPGIKSVENTTHFLPSMYLVSYSSYLTCNNTFSGRKKKTDDFFSLFDLVLASK